MPRSRVALPTIALGFGLVFACADDGPAGTDDEVGTSEGTDTTGPSTDTSGPSTDTDTGSESDSSDGPSPDLPDEQPGEVFDGEPLPPASPGDWNWIDIPEAQCIDGSPAGIGVRYGISDELVIFFEGGGGCFNPATCGLFYASFANFDQLTFDLIWQNTVLQSGIFSTLSADNPVRDWNFVYVPYCTGDVHAGAAPDTPVPGYAFDQPQQFVGYTNVHHFLDRVVPTFPDSSHVLVAGISAGGFGAAFNYDRIAKAFPDTKVTLIDDSGPPLTDSWLAPCLQQTWRELYDLDATLPADCTECFQPDGGGIHNLAAYIANEHPDQTLALISAEQDLVIRTFFGYGIQNEGGPLCPEGIFELPMDGAYFQDGLYALRSEVTTQPNWGSYLMPGVTHTYLSFPDYYLKTVNGIRMVDWVRNVLEGQPSHISP
ncbi:pectin acetylesterase-family hydrolase [Nannocystaceae bacterium ST9]